MNQHIDLNNDILMQLLPVFDSARKEYIHRTGKKPTHIVLDVATFQALCVAVGLTTSAASDGEPSTVLGMEIVVSEVLPYLGIILARRP
jgi:hypothetical protein